MERLSQWLADLYSAAELKLLFIFGIVGGFITQAVGGWDKQICALLGFIALDYLTGMYASWRTKTLSSAIGFKGLLKKAAIIAVVAFFYWADCLFKTETCRYGAIAGFGIMEIMSIIENADRGGWGHIFPPWLRNKLQAIKSERTGSG